MSMRTRSYERWKAECPANTAWVEQVDRALGPYRSERPRDPDEAELLREIGTPEELIGPVRQRSKDAGDCSWPG
jgi:hypothetical protein